MRCPSCGYGESKVVDSRPADDGASIRRRRECLECGNRFTTYERLGDNPLVIIKSDNSSEAFSRDKLFRGILIACAKRPITPEQISDIIDNIERDFQENDHISLIIHYDPILTGDDAVGTAREWVKELVRSISPELSIHDFRMVQGPSHTNLIFDTVVPHNFPLSDAALRKRIQSLVETHDAGETKYYAVVTIDHSYAAIPGACKTDGKE